MTMQNAVTLIGQNWGNLLREEFSAPYFGDLIFFLEEDKKKHTIYPTGQLVFNAFTKTPLEQLKVVVIGQDPYHGPGQAHGLSFSVPDGIKAPPSLANIYKELYSDLKVAIPSSGNLGHWAEQGVLLLNSTLTVRANLPASHKGKGWEIFTDAVIRKISSQKAGIVFLLWGKFAHSKEKLIDEKKHCILKAAHPSPFSAHRGFLGCRHFSKTNEFLLQNGKTPINWAKKETLQQ